MKNNNLHKKNKKLYGGSPDGSQIKALIRAKLSGDSKRIYTEIENASPASIKRAERYLGQSLLEKDGQRGAGEGRIKKILSSSVASINRKIKKAQDPLIKQELRTLRKEVKKRLAIKKTARKIVRLNTKRKNLRRSFKRLKSTIAYQPKLAHFYKYPGAKINALKKEISNLKIISKLARLKKSFVKLAKSIKLRKKKK